MTIYVEIEPERTDLFEAGPEDEQFVDQQATPLAENLLAAYRVRVAAYHRDLAAQVQLAAYDGTEELPESAFPVIQRSDSDEEVTIDGDLFGLLLDVYIFEGWAALARIEAELERKARPRTDRDLAGGVKAQVWLTAYDFFVFCRNMIAALIAASIADLERRAAQRMIAQLAVSAAKLAAAWTSEFGIRRVERLVTSSKPEVPPQVVTSFVIDNKSLVAALMTAVGDAVRQRVAFEKLLDSITHAKDALRTVDARLARKRRHGITPPKQRVEQRDRMAAAITAKEDLRDATRGYYDAMKAIIGLNCPWGLLVVDSLAPGFTQGQLEDQLGRTLWQLYERLDDLGKGIDPEVTRSASVLQALPAVEGRPIDPYALQRAEPPSGGPEAAVAAMALAALSDDDHGVMPLLHAETWRMLLHRGEITEDSFEYVVMHRYLEALGDRMDEISQGEQATAALVRTFGKVTAALSIALLVTPLAEAAPALRTVSFLADMALMAYSISSVTGQLGQLDQALSDSLAAADAFATPGLARIGELILARTEFAESLTTQLVLELLLVMAGGTWPRVQKLLIARGFYLDLKTITGMGEDG